MNNLDAVETDDPEEAKMQALRGIEFCLAMRNSLRDLTQAVVDGARRNGASWAEIGRTLGSSRQAAQKMYGTSSGLTGPDHPGDPEAMTLYPVTAFDEMARLEPLGAIGWHAIGVGLQSHELVRDARPWQHKRTILGSKKAAQLDREGWERVPGGSFPWVYFARPVPPDDAS